MKIMIALIELEPLLRERAIATMIAAHNNPGVVLPRTVKPTYRDDGTVKPITKGGVINEVA